jgi:glycosyltransferase involved in cell wall biosynthesis
MSTDTLHEEPLLISIVTPCLNRVDFVAMAIQSVYAQEYNYYEHIVIDGGSTDGTLDVLSQYSNIKVVSESDQGIYDAINKGILSAQGQVIGLLNTDDFYEPGAFSVVSKHFKKYIDVDAVVGGADIRKKTNQGDWEVVKEFSPITAEQLWRRVTVGIPAINAWFFRRSVFDKLGLFNTEYQIAADRDFLFRFALRGLKIAQVNQMIYHYQQHPGSITMDGVRDSEEESVNETRRLGTQMLAETEISPVFRRYLLEWQSEILAGQVIGAIRLRKPERALDYMLQGWRQDRRWPAIFLRKITTAFIERLR